MRTLFARLFALGVLVSVPFGASAANIDLDHWQIEATEDSEMRLNLSVTYTGSDASIAVDIPAPQDDSTPPTPTFQTGDILIHEFVSDPISGQEEWVELVNNSSSTIDLTDWYLTEGSGKVTPLHGPLESSEHLVVFSPSGSLNNNGDQISLYDPNDTWIDSVSYGDWPAATAPAVRDPFSVGLDDSGNFVEMEPTPGEENRPLETDDNNDSGDTEHDVEIATEETGTSPNANTTDSNTETSYENPAGTDPAEGQETACTTPDHAEADTSHDASDIPFVALANIRNEELGTELVTEGLVSVVPGTLGQQYFYVAGSGAQVYMYSKAFPELERGMRIRVQGELTETQGETRIKTSDTTDITILGQEDAPTPHTLTAEQLGEATEGWLAEFSGTVTDKSSGEFMLADDTGEIRVVIKTSTNISTTPSVGDTLTVTGIVSQTSSGYRLLPRDQQDLAVTPVEEDASNEPMAGGMLSSGSGGSGTGVALTGVALLSMLVSGSVYVARQYGFNQLVTA